MKISEVTSLEDIESLMSIVATYVKNAGYLEVSRTQLLRELGEVHGNRNIYIATENGMVVAMVQLILNNADNDPELANGINIAHAHNLQVRSELQGRGIGRKMMEFVEEKAQVLGKTTLTLGVDDGNDRAIELYKRLGYRVFKEGPGRTPEEKGFDMKKSLQVD